MSWHAFCGRLSSDAKRKVSFPLNTLRLTEKSAPSYWQNLFAWDSILFFMICSLDMLSTLWWVHRGIAQESNPWLAACLKQGPLYFCLAKMVSYLPVLLICAYFRAAYPRFIPIALRWGIALYVAIYLG